MHFRENIRKHQEIDPFKEMFSLSVELIKLLNIEVSQRDHLSTLKKLCFYCRSAHA